MTNTISRRIYDFLKDFPPFNLLDAATLLRISEQVVVQYRPPGEVIFRAGDRPEQYIYMVREGAVDLYLPGEDTDKLADQCEEGDVFGIRPLLADDVYALTAKAAEESLLYAVPARDFQALVETNPKLSFYLASNMAAGLRRGANPAHRGRLQVAASGGEADAFQLLELQTFEQGKPPVSCLPDTTIQDAAQLMTAREVGSIIVVSGVGHPLGIVTDKDLRRQVATGRLPLQAPVSDLMSSPVITVPPAVTVADVQIAMVKHRIHHLCITADGSNHSAVLGVVSEHDLLVLQGNNPAVLIREIRRAQSAAQLRQLRERAENLLRQYLLQEVAIGYITTILTEINDEVIRRCIQLSGEALQQAGQPDPGVPFCWLSLGSEGRGEQLLRTDQDNALLFADVPTDRHAAVKAYFLDLAKGANDLLNEVGFEYCPAEMMAGNPSWCKSLSEWKDQFSAWIRQPTPESVLHCTIFFDYRPAFGEPTLAEQLTAHIFEEISHASIFLSFLAKNALDNPPPLTFFRNFVVESSGEHRDEFDLKARAMMPLADAARVLVLHARLGKVNNTFRRFDQLAELEPNHRELYQEAADAYEILIRLRALQGLKNGDSGRYFNPAELTKMERILLRNAFHPVKALQSMLEVRFQLAYFR